MYHYVSNQYYCDTVDGRTLVCRAVDSTMLLQSDLMNLQPYQARQTERRELWSDPTPNAAKESPRAVRYVTHCAVAVNGNTQVLLAMSKLDGVPLDQWLLGSYSPRDLLIHWLGGAKSLLSWLGY